MSFYERFVLLCEKKGVKPSRAASECNINRSNVTNWKNNGYTPRGDVLQRIADYFGVSTDYLLGLTTQAELDTLEHQISQLKKEILTASDPERKEMEATLAILEESYDDLCFAIQMTQKNTPTEMVLDEGEKLLINLYRRLPEDKRQLVLQTVKAFAESL